MFLSAYGFSKASYQLAPERVEQMLNGENLAEIDPVILEPLVGKEYQNDVVFKRALRQQLNDDIINAHEGDLIRAAIDMNPYIVLTGILGFVASFAVSLGPVMWVLLSEIYPNAIRGLAMTVVTLVNSGISWAVQFFFPWQVNSMGNALTFLIYGLFAVVSLILVIALLKETKGKSLEQIEREYTGSTFQTVD